MEVILISCLQDQASSRSSGDLLILLVPEGIIRDIRGLWAPSAMLAARAGCRAFRMQECREQGGPPGMVNGGLVAGTPLQ